MRSYDVMVDVTGDVDLDDKLQTAVTVHLPDRTEAPVTIMVGLPGGGYGRKYYDIGRLPGYSQATYHTDRGAVFVACDHMGVGESSQPDMFSLSYERLAAADHATTVRIVEWIQHGTLAEDVPPIDVDKVIGMGQSMGGCLLTVQQARHRTFDGVAFLGWSGIHTTFPASDGGRIIFPVPARGTDLRSILDQILAVAPTEEHFRFCFHWPDEEPALMDADLASYRPFSELVRGDESTPWGSASVPACAITMMSEGAVANEAAAIDVPVLVACGERDVVADPRFEPSAYRSSRDISVSVVPRMAHMHNFARTREVLWDRIIDFARSVRAR